MAIRYDTFYKKYQPEMDETGESLKQYEFNDPFVVNTPEGEKTHLWTMLDCDGKMIIVPGWHRVNRMYYIRTKVAWTDPELEVKY